MCCTYKRLPAQAAGEPEARGEDAGAPDGKSDAVAPGSNRGRGKGRGRGRGGARGRGAGRAAAAQVSLRESRKQRRLCLTPLPGQLATALGALSSGHRCAVPSNKACREKTVCSSPLNSWAIHQ